MLPIEPIPSIPALEVGSIELIVECIADVAVSATVLVGVVIDVGIDIPSILKWYRWYRRELDSKW